VFSATPSAGLIYISAFANFHAGGSRSPRNTPPLPKKVLTKNTETQRKNLLCASVISVRAILERAFKLLSQRHQGTEGNLSLRKTMRKKTKFRAFFA
jgi:hypothetical protein